MAPPRSHYEKFVSVTRSRVEGRWYEDGKPSGPFVQGWRHLNALDQLQSPTAEERQHRADVVEGLSEMPGPSASACPIMLVEVAERIFDWPMPALWPTPDRVISHQSSKDLCRLAQKLIDGADHKTVGFGVWGEFRFAEFNYRSVAVLTALERVGRTLHLKGASRRPHSTKMTMEQMLVMPRIFAEAAEYRRDPEAGRERLREWAAERERERAAAKPEHWGLKWSRLHQHLTAERRHAKALEKEATAQRVKQRKLNAAARRRALKERIAAKKSPV